MAARFFSILCNVIASLIGWGSLAISIASVAVADWVNLEDTRYGLFEFCKKSGEKNCSRVEDLGYVDHWLHATRAFIIMMIVFGGFSCIANFVSQLHKSAKTLRIASAFLFFLAGFSGIVGCAIFTGKKELERPEYEYGSAYILAWISTWSYFVAGLFQAVSGCVTPKYEVH